MGTALTPGVGSDGMSSEEEHSLWEYCFLGIVNFRL